MIRLNLNVLVLPRGAKSLVFIKVCHELLRALRSGRHYPFWCVATYEITHNWRLHGRYDHIFPILGHKTDVDGRVLLCRVSLIVHSNVLPLTVAHASFKVKRLVNLWRPFLRKDGTRILNLFGLLHLKS